MGNDLHDRCSALEEALGYTFLDRKYLVTALTHTSYVKGDGKHAEHNERMEFLGDAVLELCVSEYLYNKHTEMSEGGLTRTRARLVCEEALFSVAQKLGIPGCLRLGHGEDRMGGRSKPSVVSDAMEAVIGAVFLDGGLEPAKKLIIGHVVGELERVAVDMMDRDYKTRLQEWAQARHLGQVTYREIGSEGPDHMRTFTMAAELNGKVLATGSGKSKQAAGQAAAATALTRCRENRTEGNERR
ncbi:MAG: ribonuclease III [Clostridia bacterium]|nr:ribonuclease III [Clostridia bacterium]